MIDIILASASPRRRELLALAGYDFSVEVSDAEETLISGTPGELVAHLSAIKAEAVAGKHETDEEDAAGKHETDEEDAAGKHKTDEEDAAGKHETDEEDAAGKHETDEEDGWKLIIGADTIVVLGDEILGKPQDEDDAFRMLKELSGRTHQVYTGVALLLLQGGRIVRRKGFSECTDVTMREISDEEIRRYIAGGEPMDKAGAYGIQGQAAVFVSGIRGDFYNVVGLPVCRLTTEIQSILFGNASMEYSVFSLR